MAKDSDTSWKPDHPSNSFSNSVQKADRAVKQAMSHPEEMAVEHAFNSIARAERAYVHAEQFNEHMDAVPQNKDQLDSLKQQLNEVNNTLEEQ
jgi:NAD(P)H-dependent flavin oxidoreductase YrpB (nitropropane dioxygenase family)